ncbi:MAG: hypothetical protein J6T80_06430 [Paludibacteraceae bacterium]|nr:hypothetical protein [Paludibacteraceae bacterium]
MKKIFVLCLSVIVSAGLWAANYGILVNGQTYYAGEHTGQFEGFEQYLVHVPVTSGDYLQLCDPWNDAKWAVKLNSYSVSGFTYDKDNNRYTVSVTGCYDFYIKLKWEADELYIGGGSNCGTGEDYATMYKGSVPPRCEAVLMQAFYNESYDPASPGVDTYGDTKWNTLASQATELGKYFDYIWLPPSAMGDGAGYHPKQYSNQNSNWGTREQLDALISALHNAGAKVVADVVINHCANKSTWCDFYEMDFGTYGKFYPDASYICKNDEVNFDDNAGTCKGKATGPDDDGDNWSGARDWSHSNVAVQNMFKAYVKWLRNVMHYDGFRYDKGDGFNNWHHNNYNWNAQPEIAFMESYNSTSTIWSEIEAAEYNLMALDFDTKWSVFNSFAGWNYSQGRGSGLLGQGKSKYAVEFIDSHDWFLRPDNENEFGGRGNSMTDALKCRLLQANAFLLSMPGVPCVFYPHWHKYKEFIKLMIEARKFAGVHSESSVTDEYAEEGGYQATIHGKYGYLILMLGNKTSHGDVDWLKDYKLMASYYETNDCGMGKNASYEIWVNRTAPIPTGVEQPTSDSSLRGRGEKFVQDGQLYIRLGDQVFDATGKLIQK